MSEGTKAIPETVPGYLEEPFTPDGFLDLRCRASRVVCCALFAALPAAAQQVDWHTRASFYFDNTEFFTPYRVGETIFGARVTSWLDAAPGPRTAVHLGFSADRRWGSTEFTDRVEPVLSFQYQTTHSQAILGTLASEYRHGLLDPIMVSTRELTAPIEYGGQWREVRKHLRGDVWMNWQQLNTATQREGFEMGAVIAAAPLSGVTIEAQHLWSHRGGQLYDAGVGVSNNRVTSLGATYSKNLSWLRESSIGVHQLWSVGHLEPPANDPRPERGRGTLLRLAVTPAGWFEFFGLTWWGKDFSAAAGDANYGSTGHDPSFYRASRRYTEIGIIRRTEIENGVTLDAEARLHRIDHEQSIAFFNTPWELSYRVVVKVPIDLALRRR